MAASFLSDVTGFMEWSWADMDTYYRDLEARPLSAHSVERFLADWSGLSERVDEIRVRLYVATTRDTADQNAEHRYRTFLEEISPCSQEAEQRLKQKLLASGLVPDGFELPLLKMREEAALFREANVPLLTEEQKLSEKYNKIIGSQTAIWEGEEIPLSQLNLVYQDLNRDKREHAWRLAAGRWLADREAINELWRQFLDVRLQLAANADCSDYRTFRWRQLLRLDYTPAETARFHQAIEEVVLPAAERIQDKRKRRLGVQTLRPWDLDVDPLGRAPLRPFQDVAELPARTAALLHRLDPELGAYFDTMVDQGLIDLESRNRKAPGGYCESFPATNLPFIFMNAIGVHRDVQTLLHESGHAFHMFEVRHLPYYRQRQLEQIGLEFAEVGSMAMELLAAPYLTTEEGGFYSKKDAARARIQQLEHIILLWPAIAAVDAFQHWVYENPAAASDPSECDERTSMLWRRFMPGVDWTGIEQELMTSWHHVLHIHLVPFYIIEYGFAQLGAVQVWANALRDPTEALKNYRRALSLGATRPLPQLYAVAGANFAFDAETLRAAVALIEETVERLEA